MSMNKYKLYLNMIIGTIGTLLVAISALRYIVEEGNSAGYYMISLGFVLTLNYINFLEEKAEISKKLTRIRAVVSIVLYLLFSYFLFL
ncbi:hypothetical protein G4D63_06905 [Bacillus mesophilus]|uniref:Uncharacterized protein n=2 Tax=Bacillus mesophilus TaxID=1808955 RepID=A0A6M0Q549_9BACI|nr:hypothetical protein [Bacillus mesophilus]